VMPGIVRTELGAGMAEARGVKSVTAEEVADEVVSALKYPRFDVFVPRSAGPLIQLSGALPRRPREAIARALKADRVAVDANRAARAAYEERAANSAPAAENERTVA
jgi:hypothetical protein